MNWEDRLGPGRNRRLDQLFVDVQRILPNVDKYGPPPRRTTALAVETKVNDGMMTSSPASIPARMAAISSAAVQEWVRRTAGAPMDPASQS